MNPRVSAWVSLLLTAALLLALPVLTADLATQDGQRMAPRLRPQKTRTLTLWLMQDIVGGSKYIDQQIALFEKANPGVRVFLRRADSGDLEAQEAVLPDVLLFGLGAFPEPDKVLRSLAGIEGVSPEALACGKSRGEQYGVPLFLAPHVLAIPTEWMPTESVPTPVPRESSFFDLGTPAPTGSPRAEPEGLAGGENGDLAQAEGLAPKQPDIPWSLLLEPGALVPPEDVPLQQLLAMCPLSLRAGLCQAVLSPQATPVPTPQKQGKIRPTPAQAQGSKAQVMTLAAYEAAVAAGQDIYGFPMTPAVTEKVLLAGLCQNNDLAKAFIRHMLSPQAQGSLWAHGLLPVAAGQGGSPQKTEGQLAPGQSLMAQHLDTLYQTNLFFPSAFEYTPQERKALCLDGFVRGADPVQTLLRLR